jgi:nucleoside permease NupC
MKQNRLFFAVFKALISMAGIFLIGYLGYHYPDAMIWLVTAAILCAFSYYFYTKDLED